jgi:hypothetical protein
MLPVRAAAPVTGHSEFLVFPQSGIIAAPLGRGAARAVLMRLAIDKGPVLQYGSRGILTIQLVEGPVRPVMSCAAPRRSCRRRSSETKEKLQV